MSPILNNQVSDIVMGMQSKQRDKHITREIHKLFWQGNFQSKGTLITGYLTRIPAFAAYNTFIPLASAYGIQAILARNFSNVSTYATWIIVLALIYSVLWTTGNIVITKNSIIGAKYVQNKVFKNIMNKDYDFYSNAFFGSVGAQAARLRDAFVDYGELVTFSLPKQSAIVCTGIGVIAYNSLPLAAVTLITMFFVLSFTILSSTWRLKYRRRVSEASSDVAAFIGDTLSHGATVKSFAMEDYEQERLQKPLNKWSHAQYVSWNLANPADNGRMILAAVATAVLLLLSARLYEQGSISVTIVVLVQLYVIRLVASTIEIAEIIKRYEQVMGAAYEPVKTMLLSNSVVDPAVPKPLPVSSVRTLQMENVSYRYSDSSKTQWAVRDFSLDIKPGEKIGLVGYSGSGKTTVTKLILRFMDTTGGAIKIDGINIRDLSQQTLRRAVSYVPQEPLLFHRTVRENIGYANPNATTAEIIRAAKLAYVDEFVKDLPKGYDTLVGERGVKLSGGQRQRVAIARAILKDSPILVLDEATSALDSRSEQFIQTALWELIKNRTSLVIAHRLSTLHKMDKLVVMDNGKIIQVGTHNELKNKPGIYADLWAHQSGGYIGVDLTTDTPE